MMAQEHAFSLAVEKIMFDFLKKKYDIENIQIPERGQYLRVIFAELTRILNHILALTTHAMDVGAITPFLWAFEEREKIMEFYERLTGARMHAVFIRPGGVSIDAPIGLLLDIFNFCEKFSKRIDEYEDMLSSNRIWRERLVNIGIVTAKDVINYSLTGVMARSAGIPMDIRKDLPYDIYNNLEFDIPITYNGDCFDRYLIRIREMRVSLQIIKQCINFMKEGDIKLEFNKVLNPSRGILKYDMDSLIHHFKIYSTGYPLEEGSIYTSVEAPKGEFGILLVSDKSNNPYKCHIRAPGFTHINALETLIKNSKIADVVTILGTLDIVFGEVDR